MGAIIPDAKGIRSGGFIRVKAELLHRAEGTARLARVAYFTSQPDEVEVTCVKFSGVHQLLHEIMSMFQV